jgi:hypothetical protein
MNKISFTKTSTGRQEKPALRWTKKPPNLSVNKHLPQSGPIYPLAGEGFLALRFYPFGSFGQGERVGFGYGELLVGFGQVEAGPGSLVACVDHRIESGKVVDETRARCKCLKREAITPNSAQKSLRFDDSQKSANTPEKQSNS